MVADVHAPDIRRYLDAAPHLNHPDLRSLFTRLAGEALSLAATEGAVKHVIDLGAGEGTAAAVYLRAGASVVAVDTDGERLAMVPERAKGTPGTVEPVLADAQTALGRYGREFDLVSAVSFLHHVPDYLSLVEAGLRVLRPGGMFFSFQDPLRHRSLGPGTFAFSRAAYFAWRIGEGDLRGGSKRYLRRRLNGYSETLPEDVEEFHAQRGGLDHRALRRLFATRGAPCRLVLYFSTQNSAFQRAGSALGLSNTFALIGGPVA